MRSSDTGFDLSFDHPGESEPVPATDAAQTLRLDLAGKDLQVTHIAITDGVLRLSLEARLTEKTLAHALHLHLPTTPAPDAVDADAPPPSPDAATTQEPTPPNAPEVTAPAKQDTTQGEESPVEVDPTTKPAAMGDATSEADTDTEDDAAPSPDLSMDADETSGTMPQPQADAGTTSEPVPTDTVTPATPETDEDHTFYLTEEDLDSDELPDMLSASGDDEENAPLGRNTNADALETLDMEPEEFLGQPQEGVLEDEAVSSSTDADVAPEPDAPPRKEVGDDILMGQDASDLLLENDFRDAAPEPSDADHGAPEEDDIEWATSLDESSMVDDSEAGTDGDAKDAASTPPPAASDTPSAERPRAPMPEEDHHMPAPPLQPVDGDDIFSAAAAKTAPESAPPQAPPPSETMTFHASSGRSGMTGTFQSKPVERMDAPKKPAAPPKPKNETSGLVKYVCPRCKTPGMAVVDKVGQIVTCDECGKALRLTLKK